MGGRSGRHETARAACEQGGGGPTEGVGGGGWHHQVDEVGDVGHCQWHVAPRRRLQRQRTLLDRVTEVGNAPAKDTSPRVRFALIGCDQVHGANSSDSERSSTKIFEVHVPASPRKSEGPHVLASEWYTVIGTPRWGMAIMFSTCEKSLHSEPWPRNGVGAKTFTQECEGQDV